MPPGCTSSTGPTASRAFSNFPNGTAHKDGKFFLGLFGANGWTGMFTAVCGGLLLFGAAQHLLAKTMSLIVGIALGAAAIIAVISGDVLGMAAANGWTELGWAVCAVILLFNTLLRAVSGRWSSRTVPSAAGAAGEPAARELARPRRGRQDPTTREPGPSASRWRGRAARTREGTGPGGVGARSRGAGGRQPPTTRCARIGPAGRSGSVWAMEARPALIEFPADDPERARRFWSELLGSPLPERAAEQGQGWQTPGRGSGGRGPRARARSRRHVLAALLRRGRSRGGGGAGGRSGGSVIHPGERWAVCRDSEGTPFGLALEDWLGAAPSGRGRGAAWAQPPVALRCR